MGFCGGDSLFLNRHIRGRGLGVRAAGAVLTEMYRGIFMTWEFFDTRIYCSLVENMFGFLVAVTMVEFRIIERNLRLSAAFGFPGYG